MDLVGFTVAIGLLAPPLMAFPLLRRAGRSIWGAIRGSALVFAIGLGIAVALTEAADNGLIPHDLAMWCYLPIMVAIAFGLYRKAL